MQTRLSEDYRNTPAGEEADRILRSCVHCGFCTATCPTYQLLGDELDGPRGRIYLLKELLEGNTVSRKTQQHLDRCLTCRACETTCPSGVRYARLLDIGRDVVEKRVQRPFIEGVTRYLLRNVIQHPRRFSLMWRLARWLKPLLPKSLGSKVPDPQTVLSRPKRRHTRRMLVLSGCAQSVVTPNTNAAAARILDQLGIELIELNSATCCGSVSHHMAASDEAHALMRRLIDAWWPYIEQGMEAIVVTASGCGVTVKDYGDILKHDHRYAEKAQRVSALTKDLSEVLAKENVSALFGNGKTTNVAFHSPCTLQHGQKIHGLVETILRQAGFRLTRVADSHLCCGSAGTYSLLQPELSRQLLENKLSALQQEQADVIATANIGCQLHMASQAKVPVRHWIELLSETLNQSDSR